MTSNYDSLAPPFDPLKEQQSHHFTCMLVLNY